MLPQKPSLQEGSLPAASIRSLARFSSFPNYSSFSSTSCSCLWAQFNCCAALNGKANVKGFRCLILSEPIFSYSAAAIISCATNSTVHGYRRLTQRIAYRGRKGTNPTTLFYNFICVRDTSIRFQVAFATLSLLDGPHNCYLMQWIAQIAIVVVTGRQARQARNNRT